jgi:hypothetical protein
MKSKIKTTATTKKGSHKVTAEIWIDAETGCSKEKITCTIEDNTYEIFLHPENDRVCISDDLAAKFGVKNNRNIVIQCDTTTVKTEKKKIEREFEASKFDCSIIDSGYGFRMKNTKQNMVLCTKYGFDAIEMVK